MIDEQFSAERFPLQMTSRFCKAEHLEGLWIGKDIHTFTWEMTRQTRSTGQQASKLSVDTESEPSYSAMPIRIAAAPRKAAAGVRTEKRAIGKIKVDPVALAGDIVPSDLPAKRRKIAPSGSELPGKPQLLPANIPFSLSAAKSHLIAHDPRFHSIFTHLPCKPFEPPYTPIDPFQTLVTSIIGQQVSWMAARAITKRFKGLFGFGDDDKGFPSPRMVIKEDVLDLKGVGLSLRKAEYGESWTERR
jgi:hypothetical protein